MMGRQRAQSRTFLYVEVPKPTLRATSIRPQSPLYGELRESYVHQTHPNGQAVDEEHYARPAEQALPTAAADFKGKQRASAEPELLERVQEHADLYLERPLDTLDGRGTLSSQQLQDPALRSPPVQPIDTQLLQAPRNKRSTSAAESSTSTLSALPSTSESDDPVQIGKRPSSKRRSRQSIAIQESDSEALIPTSAPSRAGARGKGGLDEHVHRRNLGVDEEIVKILGRQRDGQEYTYTVKLNDGQKAVVSESALLEYQDLLDYFQSLVDSGWREDNQVYTDSDQASANGQVSMAGSGSDDAYEEEGAASASGPVYTLSSDGEEDEGGTSQPDEHGEEANDSDVVPSQRQGERRSSRGGTKKKVNYRIQTVYDEEEDQSDDVVADSSSEDAESSDRPQPRRFSARNVGNSSDEIVVSSHRVPSGHVSGKKKAAAYEVEEIDTDLRDEQLHRDACSNTRCGASSAKELLPAFLKKQKRKRKKAGLDDDDLDIDSIRQYGCWIHCEVCSSSWHWNCLPGHSSANSLKVVFKKWLAHLADSQKDSKTHLDIERAFTIPACPDCLKPHGTRCMLCLQEVPALDITNYAADVSAIPKSRKRPLTPEPNVSKSPEVSDLGPDALSETALQTATYAVEGGSFTTERAQTSVPEEETRISTEDLDGQATASSGPDLLFRCSQCKRPAHYACMPGRQAAEKWQYHWDWHCADCKTWGPIDAVLAWRPIDWDHRRPLDEGKPNENRPTTPEPSSPRRLIPSSPGKRPAGTNDVPDHKASWWNAEYLVKFKETSFRHVQWVPHTWLFSSYKQRLRNFLVDGPLIDITPENSQRDGEEDVDDDHLDSFSLFAAPDAASKIPKEWLTPDRILDVHLKAKSGRDPVRAINMKGRMSDEPLENIERISSMYVKWQGLPYNSATWESEFPKPDDPQYNDFVKAYGDYLRFRHVDIPRPTVKELELLDRSRGQSLFKEVTEQPDFIRFGKLMDFQLLGVSWLYYNWWIKKGCILADEMGLGKTVQIISFLSILFKTENCKPFLVVVPNSTLQNWQREFQRWAPEELRVVPYYGSKASRRIIEEYELFTSGLVSEQKLRTHVVLTTYESILGSTSLLKRVTRWEALIVDEAQRLKSGPKNLLWRALSELRFGHKVLLTGTPVNNNLDELFNLLHFLDPEKFDDLNELHNRYETLTPALVEEVQQLAQPYFLRRTKEAVLNLPPLSEVIVPLSMSDLQKVVYKSVLEKNMDALKAIYDSAKAKTRQKMNRGKVVNVLMELRKTLCHPYLVREELEHEGDFDKTTIFRNLLEASSKLRLLNDLLPKLKERGHRVLLFSQFVIVLNVVERFLEGAKIKFVRLDGSTNQADRQKRIDAYNAPESDIQIFILTTRAGGVGINLATADTVILFDPDFNPFQDLQAISRAHRIGQTKKVMCLKLMVKGTCEEKIIESGKKKMVLEQLIVDSGDLKQKGDEVDDGANNVESLLLFGAQALFNEESGKANENDITYSSRDLDELIEKTENEEPSAEAKEEKKRKTIEANKAFSYARVWERQNVKDAEEADRAEVEAQRSFWKTIIEAREKEQKDQEIARMLQAGRGHRTRRVMDYKNLYDLASDGPNTTRQHVSDSDGDFDATKFSDISSDDDNAMDVEPEDANDIHSPAQKRLRLMAGPDQYATNGAPLSREPLRPIYTNPIPGSVPANILPHPRFEVARSPTPPEILEKRQALLMNLLKRAEHVKNENALKLIRQASQASDSLEQVVLCQQATAVLKDAEQLQTVSSNMYSGELATGVTSGTNSSGTLPSPATA